MPDGLSCIGDMAKVASLENAVKLASYEGWLDCCKALPIPHRSMRLTRVDPDWLREMRAKNAFDDEGLVAEYNVWETGKANALAENESRLRGALWCWRRLRQEYDVAPDPSLKTFCRRVRDFLRDEWGISDPPRSIAESYALARRIVGQRVYDPPTEDLRGKR